MTQCPDKFWKWSLFKKKKKKNTKNPLKNLHHFPNYARSKKSDCYDCNSCLFKKEARPEADRPAIPVSLQKIFKFLLFPRSVYRISFSIRSFSFPVLLFRLWKICEPGCEKRVQGSGHLYWRNHWDGQEWTRGSCSSGNVKTGLRFWSSILAEPLVWSECTR